MVQKEVSGPEIGFGKTTDTNDQALNRTYYCRLGKEENKVSVTNMWICLIIGRHCLWQNILVVLFVNSVTNYMMAQTRTVLDGKGESHANILSNWHFNYIMAARRLFNFKNTSKQNVSFKCHFLAFLFQVPKIWMMVTLILSMPCMCELLQVFCQIRTRSVPWRKCGKLTYTLF